MQMKATGDVRIAGQVPNEGEFSVQAEAPLPPNQRRPYFIRRRAYPRQTLASHDGRRRFRRHRSPEIRYVRSTGETQVEASYFEFTLRDMQIAERPKTSTDRKCRAISPPRFAVATWHD